MTKSFGDSTCGELVGLSLLVLAIAWGYGGCMLLVAKSARVEAEVARESKASVTAPAEVVDKEDR